MPRLETEARPADWLGPDPGPRIRRMVAMMLRLAMGISLLGAGLARYLGARQTNQVPGMTMMLGSFEFLDGPRLCPDRPGAGPDPGVRPDLRVARVLPHAPGHPDFPR